jgi:alpha-beta hydrolase superfamily lysophospholipase
MARLWSSVAVDPSANVFSGAFQASDGASVPYRLWPVSEPRAQVLLLHGAFDHAGAFDEIGPVLAKRRLAALAYDQRGFGATRSRRHWCGRKRMVRDVSDACEFLRERFGQRPLFVLGESMGATVAVHAAASGAAPGVSGLILVAPGAIAGAFRRLAGSMLISTLNYFAPKSEIVVERISGWELTPSAAIRLLCDPLVLRKVKPAMAYGLLELAVTSTDAARKIDVPTVTMMGSKDDLLHTASVKRLYAALAGEKSWRDFQNGPHLLLHWSRGQEVLDAAVGWIEALLHVPTAETAAAPSDRGAIAAQ